MFFDQNYQFEEIARLRRSGVRTVGRFVWEAFAADNVALAQEAFDLIYSLTASEQRRYAEPGSRARVCTGGATPSCSASSRTATPARSPTYIPAAS